MWAMGNEETADIHKEKLEWGVPCTMIEVQEQPRNSLSLLYTAEEGVGFANISIVSAWEQSGAEVIWDEKAVLDTFEIHSGTRGRLCRCPEPLPEKLLLFP